VEKAEDTPETEVKTITRPHRPRISVMALTAVYLWTKLSRTRTVLKQRKQRMILPYDLFAVDILNNEGDHLVHMIATRPEGAIDILLPQKSVVSKDESSQGFG